MKKTSILVLLSLILISSACDLAKPQNKGSVSDVPEAPVAAPQSAPPVKEAVADKDVDTSIKLNGVFEDKEYGFSFNYSSNNALEKGEGFIGSGNLSLWFSKRQKLDSDAVLMTVKWMFEEKQFPSNEKSEISKAVKQNGGSLKSYEKVTLDGKECVHIRVAFGGMMDPMGSRISEQYFLKVKRGSDLVINFSGPAKEFDKYKPQFNAVLNSFKFDKETTESE